MRFSEQIDKLAPAWHLARKAMSAAAKSGRNEFQRYSYPKEEDWFEAVKDALNDHGFVLTMGLCETTNLENRTTQRGGTEYCVQVKVIARLLHSSGQWAEIDSIGQGQDNADKAVYKAITGAKKYAYALLFALPSSDDPEHDETDRRTQAEGDRQRKPATNGKSKEPPRQKAPASKPEPNADEDPQAKLENWFKGAKVTFDALPKDGEKNRKTQLFAWLDTALTRLNSEDAAKRWTKETAGWWVGRCMDSFGMPDYLDAEDLRAAHAHAAEVLSKIDKMETKG